MQTMHIDTADNLIEMMVHELGQWFVDVTREVFMDMNRPDLVQRMSEISSESKGKLCEN